MYAKYVCYMYVVCLTINYEYSSTVKGLKFIVFDRMQDIAVFYALA